MVFWMEFNDLSLGIKVAVVENRRVETNNNEGERASKEHICGSILMSPNHLLSRYPTG